ncbi:hypothetical protein KIPB_002836 [Kipferlia bialata]|uniref:Uncharacterized protein n=1 Tax=Kipferlia bialata TaxID=797122 RepID=A0A9K3CUG4_9EUKA|nr:hypothetical protein KIPB_002836 [Kipferlia bialata]|eukprot:g2836.t1
MRHIKSSLLDSLFLRASPRHPLAGISGLYLANDINAWVYELLSSGALLVDYCEAFAKGASVPDDKETPDPNDPLLESAMSLLQKRGALMQTRRHTESDEKLVSATLVQERSLVTRKGTLSGDSVFSINPYLTRSHLPILDMDKRQTVSSNMRCSSNYEGDVVPPSCTKDTDMLQQYGYSLKKPILGVKAQVKVLDVTAPVCGGWSPSISSLTHDVLLLLGVAEFLDPGSVSRLTSMPGLQRTLSAAVTDILD